MTLQASGQISFADVGTELTKPQATQIGLGDADVRALAGISSGDITAADLYGKQYVAPAGTPIYVGLSTVRLATEAMIQTLPMVNLLSLPYAFDLNAGSGQYQYWASPVSLGAVKFYDTESMFVGGWDGASNNTSKVGPIQLTINSIQYYVYRSDFSNLGPCFWEARHDANPYY